MSADKNDLVPNLIPGNPSWHQTMLRIADPVKSLSFYCDRMGMTLLDKIDFPEFSFSLYFLATLPADEEYDLIPGSVAAHRYLWSFPGTTIELTHNYDPERPYHAGNQERDGFGHVAFLVDDVARTTDELLAASVEFSKRPLEGKTKGIAFASDPDGYWVELVKRAKPNRITSRANFSQTMLRVKDPAKSIAFYQSLGMILLHQEHFPQREFSLYYLASMPPTETPPRADAASEETSQYVNSRFGPVLKLTHNHGSERDNEFRYLNGNESGRQGFGHIGFLVDDVDVACRAVEQFGYGFKKRPTDGNMKGLAFAFDPDGYWVEIIKRGGYDAQSTPYYFER